MPQDVLFSIDHPMYAPSNSDITKLARYFLHEKENITLPNCCAITFIYIFVCQYNMIYFVVKANCL